MYGDCPTPSPAHRRAAGRTTSSQARHPVASRQVRAAIGSLAAKSGGIDALVFTGGIGENRPEIRAGVCDSLGALGVRLDPERNASVSGTEGRMQVCLFSKQTNLMHLPLQMFFQVKE